ncbi:hypothetical protein ACVFI8_19555 [Agarivorans sp. MS3-6]
MYFIHEAKMVVALVCLLVLQACSATAPQLTLSCEPALKRLDKLLVENVGTLKGERVAATAWLRYDRFIYHYLENSALPSGAVQATLIDSMSALAISGLQAEWLVLETKYAKEWLQSNHVVDAKPFIEQCVSQLAKQYKTNPEHMVSLLASVPPDEDYSSTAKVFGLYPISSKIFASAVVKEQTSLRHQWQAASRSPLSGFSEQEVALYIPAQRSRKLDAAAVEFNQFGQLSAQHQQTQLLDWHAPQWLIENSQADNLPGSPYWRQHQLEVDTTQPVSFSKISYGRFKGRTSIQLNYVLWFKQRPKLSSVDWVAGRHDALVFRVHLSPQLEVIAYDSIHLCGCWYTLMLPKERAYEAIQDPKQESVLMYRVDTAEQMRISVSADTHQIINVRPVVDDTLLLASQREYQLAPWGNLLSLEHEQGYQAIYDPQGYVWGSQRLERWFFWPMGVKQPGTLRRFGDHAISFVGERYFDQAHLLEDLGVQ